MPVTRGSEVPPPFLRLAGDPVRWRLLRELASSDRRVRELVEAVGEPQNLVSYHLGKLRAAGLVGTRRSSFDGRDTYYRLDLERCAEALAGAGAALHPGLRADPAPAATPRSVLFLCTGNSARSPIAEALLRHRAGARMDVSSAGSQPKPLNPNAVRVMADYGIPLRHEPTHLDSVSHERFHLVITLCDRVREVCPPFPRVIHWSVPEPRDPEAFRRTATELDTRIRFLQPVLADLKD